tara:strand:+ start:167 stop:313 length:147 start_codon:yes stop_codon:yes gene_type:complete
MLGEAPPFDERIAVNEADSLFDLGFSRLISTKRDRRNKNRKTAPRLLL